MQIERLLEQVACHDGMERRDLLAPITDVAIAYLDSTPVEVPNTRKGGSEYALPRRLGRVCTNTTVQQLSIQARTVASFARQARLCGAEDPQVDVHASILASQLRTRVYLCDMTGSIPGYPLVNVVM